MPFVPAPIFPGDAHETARRLAEDVAAALLQAPDAAAEFAALHAAWSRVVSLGWPATLVAEEAGGAGGMLEDLAALADGAGHAALPLPLAAACAVAPHLLAMAPGHPLLAELAGGTARPCPILPEAARDPGMVAPHLDGVRLRGGVVGVEVPPDPTHLLLVAGDALLLLPADAAGISHVLSQRIDRRLAADWDFAEVVVRPEAVIAQGPAVRRRAVEAHDLGALVTCVEATAACGALIAQTIAHLSTRVQFGAPLAANQALRHRVAEMYVEYETLRALVVQAVRAADTSIGAAWEDIAFAKLRLGQAGRAIAEAAIQCHGGMGLTDHLPATRLARRILMAEHEYGDRAFQAARLSARAA
jgi:alkylation response protein AidB-like acyl-CoA dehydrogenase